jgi:pimeloyl-ACP methyl ester carboxylesterase
MSEKVRVGDIEMNYRILGEGKPLVMIMGLTASMDVWDPRFVEELAKHYRLLLFDNRGAGLSTAGEAAFTMKQFADDTAGLMDALGIARAFILGESMGGMIAQEFALNHPDKTEKLVLFCTFCGGEQAQFPSQEVLDVLADLSGTPEDIARRGLTIGFPDEWVGSHPEIAEDVVRRTILNPMSEENALKQGMAVFAFCTYDGLPEIRCPTLVMCGTEDVLIPPVNSGMLADRIPGAKLVEFEGGGHGFHTQFHDRVAREVISFLG